MAEINIEQKTVSDYSCSKACDTTCSDIRSNVEVCREIPQIVVSDVDHEPGLHDCDNTIDTENNVSTGDDDLEDYVDKSTRTTGLLSSCMII